MVEYGTTDTELAAYLVLQGARVDRAESDGPVRVRFMLAGLEHWEYYRQAFCTDEARVPPFAYATQLRRLKNIAMSHRRQTDAGNQGYHPRRSSHAVV